MTDGPTFDVADIDARIPDLVALIGRDDFYPELASLLDGAFGFHHFHIFHYTRRGAPTVLASRPTAFGYETGMHNYVSYTYVINPVFRAYQRNAEPGVYMIADLLGDDRGHGPPVAEVTVAEVDVLIEDSEAIGYRTPGWPRNLTELIMLVTLDDGSALDLSFMTECEGRALGRYRQALERLFPLLNGILRKQHEICPCHPDGEGDPGQEDRFLDFGEGILTAREQEIVRQILVGHGSNAIALNLDVSLPTVKTHRRNIYAKLRISSQAELFSLFLLHLK